DCDGVIEAVNDNLGTFSIGETVTFHPSQILANYSGNGLSVVEICTTSTNGGTIEDNGNGAYTYSPPSPNVVGTDTLCYTITDAEGNTDEAFVSVVYGDLKFVAEIDYTCDEGEGTYTLILTIQGSISDYLVEVLFPEEQAVMTVPQGVIGLGPFSLETPNYSVRITQLNTGGSRIIDGVVFDCVTLPIELVSFEGEILQDGNLLKWVTASEVNNDFFSLQRSLEGTNFDKIHMVDGAGTSTTVNSYSYMDRDAGAGIQYYRLQQTDFDGNSTTSNVIALQRGEMDGGFDIISVKPLGNYQNTTIDFQVPAIGKVTAKIFDVSARLLHTTSMEASEGVNTLQLNMSNYLEGIYLLQLQHGDDLRTVKILR
ncbi:MAG: cadherin-like domain-containing protein, partial [Chitinophagales bacterium]